MLCTVVSITRWSLLILAIGCNAEQVLVSNRTDISQEDPNSSLAGPQAVAKAQSNRVVARLHVTTTQCQELPLITGFSFEFFNGSRYLYPDQEHQRAKLHGLPLCGISYSEIDVPEDYYLKSILEYVGEGSWRYTALDFETESGVRSSYCCSLKGCLRSTCFFSDPSLTKHMHSAPFGFQIIGLVMAEGNLTYLPADIIVAPAPIWPQPPRPPSSLWPKGNMHIALIICSVSGSTVGFTLLCYAIIMCRRQARRGRVVIATYETSFLTQLAESRL